MSSGWVEPRYTRSRVAAAGKRIRKGLATPEDWDVLENWRRAHAYVLNTFQMRLRNTQKRFDGEVQVAQRHKRRPTIVDKLNREPSMQLASMHDIAGCRAICESIAALNEFRDTFLHTRAKHRHLNREPRAYDYIASPKTSGYRGMHDIFATVLPSETGSKWNDLKVEIQFRTRAQHAWATAVETVDLLNGERAKFGQASPQLQRFFVVASELIARVHEDNRGTVLPLDDRVLVSEYSALNKELGIVRRLERAVASNPKIPRGRNTILIFHFGDEQRLEVATFDSIGPAQSAYTELEQAMEGKADVVLVKSESSDDIRRAFQNYFTDAQDFVKLVDVAYKYLR